MASLVLAIVGFPGLFLTALPAVICGHVGLRQIRRSAGRLGGQGMAIAGLAIGYSQIALALLVMVPLIVAISLPAFSRARETARRAVCASRLRQIGIACRTYAKDNDGQYPDELSRLYPKYVDTPSVFICPSDKREAIKAANEKDGTIGVSSYLYLYAPAFAERDPECVIVMDRPENHVDGYNELSMDGQVRFVRTTSRPATQEGNESVEEEED